ncbi:hypothetical protein BBJ28_00004285 [Nothophytophthora sp. Chile5]|nr:hypothetical protein BBJ28_00004285 [Nothophytophthora sp. Chile5]
MSTGQAKTAPAADEGATCLYPSKRCDNPRALKPNGELHKFCELHRQKANYNQRRLEHKRKFQQEPAHSSAPPMPAMLGDMSGALEADDIRILQDLLDVNEEPGSRSAAHCP